ncbi:2-dehydropantoate 2-reductase [Thalassotalea sp. M1531]|uniref:2-dehydropantoate 2-reductase n=1 Tax=Thalassotalea algicola TaxID=2716224 RepID=A0A7Y0Q6K8_9GAMM|nr:2-dehydropantoate 2-reductase [Thalassotalea algicola]NMP30947.1 2-dehydropantoate 2-reductase [Thalassotalea algicola]
MNNMPIPLQVVVVGQGAIGSLWSYYLNKSPHIKLSLLKTTKTSTAQSQQLTFTNANGLSYSYRCNLALESDIVSADLILVCLKSIHIVEQLRKLSTLISKNTAIVLCHNGMGIINRLDSTLDKKNIFTLLTTHGSYRTTKQHAIHTGIGHCDIGSSNSILSNPPPWFKTLNQAFPKLYWHEDIVEKQWFKLAINCVINPITAINNIQNGDVINQKYQPLIKEIASEVSEVAKKENIKLSAKDIIDTALKVAKSTQLNSSSMLSDILANRETEVDNINGYIAKLAQQHNLNAPVNQHLTTKVKALIK